MSIHGSNSRLLVGVLYLLRHVALAGSGASVAFATAGCGSDSKAGHAPVTPVSDAGQTNNVSDSGASNGCNGSSPASPSPNLTGRWAMQTVASRYVPATGLTSAFYTKTTSVLLADITATGTQISLSAQYCDQFAEDPTALAHVVIPDAYKRSLASFVRTGTYSQNSAGIDTLTLPSFVEVEGATLADPAHDALPTVSSDSRVVDQDQDGNPGVTIKLSGLVSGDLYVVQRQISELTGFATSQDSLRGQYGFTSEQIILDSNPTTLKSLAAQTANVDPDACASNFALVRVASTATCADVLANATLFD